MPPDYRQGRFIAYLTEIADPRQFCSRCHQDWSSRHRSAVHWQAVGRAHIKGRSGRGSSLGDRLDSDTSRCLNCHDGVNASEAAYSTKWSKGGSYLGDKRRNHPVGVDYPLPGKRRNEASVRSDSSLPGNMLLPNNTVSCVSCHDLHALQPGLLTVPMEGSRLCLTCHDMS